MYSVSIINKYAGYSEVNNEIVVNPEIKCEHTELIEIFKDLFCFCGEYKVYYEYDGKHIILKRGYHIPLGQKPILITHDWGDYVIENMNNWSYKNRVINEI